MILRHLQLRKVLDSVENKKGGYGIVFQEIMRSKELEPESKAIYAYLCSFAGIDSTCFPSRELMRKELGMSETRFSKYLKPLVSLGVVKVERTKIGNLLNSNSYTITHKIRFIENSDTPNYSNCDARESLNCNARELGHSDIGSSDNLSTNNNSLKSNSLNNNNINNNKVTNNNNICADAPKRTRSQFKPPTLEEVQAYCRERNNKVDAERFIDYYSSNGWMVGKNKMKDWKAAVRTWERNQYSNGTSSGNKAANKPYEENKSFYDMYQEMMQGESAGTVEVESEIV